VRSHLKRLGWDLSYKTVLDANHVAPSEWFSQWIGPNTSRRPADGYHPGTTLPPGCVNSSIPR
jgi:hypothetical protein